MGLRSKLNKMKNFLFDEEDVEKPQKKSNKKKVAEKETIVENIVQEKEQYDDFYFDDISDSEDKADVEVKSRMTKESEFKFPEFDDDDFVTPARKEPEIKTEIKDESKPILYQGSKRREETKKFKPSPIISPIYGLLDQEGNKVKSDVKKNDTPLKNKEDLTFDEIRKKAYGLIDDEFESTISKLSKKTIEEAEKDMEREEREIPSRTLEKSKASHEKNLVAPSIEDDDMVLPNVNFKEIDIDKERIGKDKVEASQVEDDDEDTKEQDLFNLIDTIYSGEENDK